MADAKDGQVKLPHYPALDGLRGIAVLIVLVAHATPIYVSGAIGVDIFFVLSGFLITSILAGEILATGRIAVGRFYGRRFLRLLPALWVTIGGLTVLKIIGGTLDEQFGWEVLWAGGYVMNWVYALGLGTSEYLGHTWSLAMEEQYYLVWPFVLIGLTRLRVGMVHGAFLLAAAAIGVMAYRHYSGFPPIRIYRGLDAHCDGLLLGSALALASIGGLRLPTSVTRLLLRCAPLALIALLLLPVWYGWDDYWMIHKGYAIVAVLATIVIFGATQKSDSLMSRFLAMRPLVYTGKLSYGLYLYHWPILTRLQRQTWITNEWIKFAICMIVTFGVAHISYVLVERPALRLKDRYFRSSVT